MNYYFFFFLNVIILFIIISIIVAINQTTKWIYKNNKITYKRRVAVMVLGDIGRSPRMQFHALSLSNLPDPTQVIIIILY